MIDDDGLRGTTLGCIVRWRKTNVALSTTLLVHVLDVHTLLLAVLLARVCHDGPGRATGGIAKEG